MKYIQGLIIVIKDNPNITGKNTSPEAYYDWLYRRINDDLASAVSIEFPPNLYNPMRYALSASGKRFRPILLIMACESVGGAFRDAYNASLAIEILHNFTLIHDDIMDNDDLRRISIAKDPSGAFPNSMYTPL